MIAWCGQLLRELRRWDLMLLSWGLVLWSWVFPSMKIIVFSMNSLSAGLIGFPGVFGVFVLSRMTSALVDFSLDNWPSIHFSTLTSNLLKRMRIWFMLSCDLDSCVDVWMDSVVCFSLRLLFLNSSISFSSLSIRSNLSSFSCWSYAYFSNSIFLSLRSLRISSFNWEIIAAPFGPTGLGFW